MASRRPNAGAGANITRPAAPGPGSSSNRTPAAPTPVTRMPTTTTRPAGETSRTMTMALASTSASASTTRNARPQAASVSAQEEPPKWSPLFGLEIEIFVKLRPEIEEALLAQRQRRERPDEDYWQKWDFELSNLRGNQDEKDLQRKCVGQAIEALIERVLGPTHGWKCEPDASLKEYYLTEPPHPRKWWGIEIISPPMSSAREWRQEIHQVFAAVAEQFELWTNTNCACHVHVSPGPRKSSKYTWEQIIRVANASFFWEEALKTLLPGERKVNRYAEPNATKYATDQYNAVRHSGWGPVFQEIQNGAVASKRFAASAYRNESPDKQAVASLTWFGYMMAGVPFGDRNPVQTGTRYLSSNFYPLDELGTIELRRQAGVASAQSAIYRALLALTLHASALRYDFAGAASRRDHPTQRELISELAGCIKGLPKPCRGDRFLKWLNDCAADYAPGQREFTEKQVNKREDDFHSQDKPLPPVPAASSRPSGRQRANSTAPPPSQSTSTTRPAAHRQSSTAQTQAPTRTRVRANSSVTPADRPSASSSSRYPAANPSAAPLPPAVRRPSLYPATNYEPAPPPGPRLYYDPAPLPPMPQPRVVPLPQHAPVYPTSYTPAAPAPPRVSYPYVLPQQPPPRDPRYPDRY